MSIVGNNVDQNSEFQVKNFYENEARRYDKKRWSSFRGRKLDVYQRRLVSALLGSGTNMEVLEIGPGTGRFTRVLRDAGAKVTAIDIAFNMLKIARDYLVEDKDEMHFFLQGSATSLPFKDNIFHGCICITTLNLIQEHETAISEISRVLRGDAFFIFNFPNLWSVYLPGAILVNSRGKAISKNEAGYRYSKWFSLSSIRRVLKRFAFKPVSIKGQPFFCSLVNTDLWNHSWPRFICPSLYIKAIKLRR